ncbi:MAG: hypothetical protein LUH07_07940 [Lachnospiraceae bacterium]|nr:hypothetical protein [Lachnospiraceae bacterium]
MMFRKAKKAKAAGADEFSGWLMDLLCEISPGLLEEEIPERDLERMQTAAEMRADAGVQTAAEARTDAEMQTPAEMQDPTAWDSPDRSVNQGGSWKRVAAISGFAAAVSAALTGIIVLVCVRHSTAVSGAK